MAAPILPNASNFLGIALVINRSRDGPRFVFHYPPQISPVNDRPLSRGAGSTNDDLDDDDALIDRISYPSISAPGGSVPKGVDIANWNHDDHLETDSGSQIVPWEHVAGFPTRDLESILTPARAYHKKLFQVSLDQVCLASYPIYVPENGVWKKKKKQPKPRPTTNLKVNVSEDGESSARNGESPILSGRIPQIETRDMGNESSAAAPPDAPDDAAASDEKKSGMTMFNLIFILNPKKHETKELVDTLYFHIIRKINKAYKYAQQRNDFVWKESKRILLLKDKGREDRTKLSVLWRQILDSSSLAASLQDVYEAVCANKIAALQLETAEGTVTHSVQIPAPFHLPDLPSSNDADSEGLQGLWITTANSFADADSAASVDDPSFLDKTFALLLLHDEKKIISELQGDPDETTNAMVEFVRLSKPTTSFHNIGQGPSLSPAQVRKYAQHFIFWRRAIAIPPLHARDIYIMSPNSKTTSLPRASQAWARAFPLAPPLPNFLADLSTAPRPYKWFAPSKIHRPQYLQMLAWLMRGGWVTQLCTFAYVVVWPEIQYEVEYQLEADDIKTASSTKEDPFSNLDEAGRPRSKESDAETETSTREREDRTRGGGGVSTEDGADKYGEVLPDDGDSTSTSLPTSSDQEPSNSPPAAETTANEQVAEAARLTRIADRATRQHAERATQHSRKHPPVATDHPSLNESPHLAHLSPYIIVDAKKATGKDSLYLSAIGRRFKDARVRASWPVFWKYFNGRAALERVALMEDLKRKEVWMLLTGMSEFLVTVRHW